MWLIGSPGQCNDIDLAYDLIEGFVAGVTIGDKGYDADHVCNKIAESGEEPVAVTPGIHPVGARVAG